MKENAQLGAIGLDEFQELIYRALLTHGDASVMDVARAVNASATRARGALAALERLGLASRVATEPRHFVASDPVAAVEVLILRRQEELARVRMALEELARDHHISARPGTPGAILQLLTGEDSVRARAEQMVAEARREIVGFSGTGAQTAEYTEMKLETLRRGVSVRGVYQHRALEHAGMYAFIRTVAEAGERIRTVASLQTTMLLVDGATALIPWNIEEARAGRYGRALLIRSGSLLTILSWLFESVWDQATPVMFSGRESVTNSSPVELSAEDQLVLTLLAAGARDDVIAKRLGVIPKTAERRVSRIMGRLGARTRFQAAILATRRGWLPVDRHPSEARRAKP